MGCRLFGDDSLSLMRLLYRKRHTELKSKPACFSKERQAGFLLKGAE